MSHDTIVWLMTMTIKVTEKAIEPKKSIELVTKKNSEIITELKKAYADEWIAYFQYKALAKIATGRGSFQFSKAILEISEDEEEHANELADRLNELGDEPITDWDTINQMANCPYPSELPDKNDLEGMARLILTDERCAIAVYDKIMKLTKDVDFKTFNLVMHILEEEIGHENKMIQFLGE